MSRVRVWLRPLSGARWCGGLGGLGYRGHWSERLQAGFLLLPRALPRDPLRLTEMV